MRIDSRQRTIRSQLRTFDCPLFLCDQYRLAGRNAGEGLRTIWCGASAPMNTSRNSRLRHKLRVLEQFPYVGIPKPFVARLVSARGAVEYFGSRETTLTSVPVPTKTSRFALMSLELRRRQLVDNPRSQNAEKKSARQHYLGRSLGVPCR